MKHKGTAVLGIEGTVLHNLYETQGDSSTRHRRNRLLNMVQKGRNIYANTNKHETGTAPHTDKPDGTYNMKF